MDRLGDAGQIVLSGAERQPRGAQPIHQEIALAVEQRAGVDGELGGGAGLLCPQGGGRRCRLFVAVELGQAGGEERQLGREALHLRQLVDHGDHVGEALAEEVNGAQRERIVAGIVWVQLHGAVGELNRPLDLTHLR